MLRIEQSLGAFSLAMLVVVLALILFLFPPTGMICGYAPFIQLPWVESATVMREGGQSPLEIRITRDGRRFIGPNIILEKDLGAAIHDSATFHGVNRPVHIRADAAAPYSSVQQIIRLAHEAGFRNIWLVTFEGSPLEAWQHELPSNSALQPTPTAPAMLEPR